jgi:hypothetical protein
LRSALAAVRQCQQMSVPERRHKWLGRLGRDRRLGDPAHYEAEVVSPTVAGRPLVREAAGLLVRAAAALLVSSACPDKPSAPVDEVRQP